MDTLTILPYWLTIVLLIINALAVSRISIDMEDDDDPKQAHD